MHRPPKLPFLAALLTVSLPVATAVAQSGIADLERKLKRADLDPAARAELVDALLDLGPTGAIAVARGTSSASKGMARAYEKSRRAFSKSFAKTAARIVATRSKGATKEIEELRHKVRAGSTDRALTKAKVKQELDPAVARLRELLTVSIDDVVYHDPKIDDAYSAVVADLDRLRDLQLDWDYAVEACTDADASHPGLAKLAIPVDADEFERELADELAYLAILATPMSAGDKNTFAANRTRAAEIDASAADGVRSLNHLRIVLGRSALRTDVKLSAACADHSADMESLGFFAHESPVEGKRTFGQRAARFGASASSENIAQGHQDGPGAIVGWWYSPGHHRNMMGDHRGVGLGRSGTYWTQNFN